MIDAPMTSGMTIQLALLLGAAIIVNVVSIRTIDQRMGGVRGDTTGKWAVRVRSVHPVTITEREGTTAVVVPAERRVS